MLTRMMVDLVLLGMTFTGALLIGIVGMSLFRLLPSSFREKIENFHDR